MGSIAELGRSLGVDPTYVGRILRLTLLAPDIVEAILDGHEPSGLSLAKKLLLLCDKQLKRFGSPSTQWLTTQSCLSTSFPGQLARRLSSLPGGTPLSQHSRTVIVSHCQGNWVARNRAKGLW